MSAVGLALTRPVKFAGSGCGGAGFGCAAWLQTIVDVPTPINAASTTVRGQRKPCACMPRIIQSTFSLGDFMNMKTVAAALGCLLVVAGLSAQSGSGRGGPGQAAGASPATAADAWYDAVRGSDRSRIEALIAQGADVNARDRRGGVTPLMYAAALGSLETMRLL